ncbi:hypothetical protein BCD27_004955 [Escherichia coli]|nr:hypothetical protein [Escherichia coli]EFK8125920.1 hypothetical protein [Escherichia coli]
MTRLPKSKEAARICEEWAADFTQRNMHQDAAFWLEVAEQFKQGNTISEAASSTIQREIDGKINAGRTMATMPMIGPVIAEIGKEAQKLRQIIES